MKYKSNTTLNIKELVLLKQYPEEYYEQEFLKTYSHLPHLADLPYDRRTQDPDKLQERKRNIQTLTNLKKKSNKIKKT